MTRQFRELALPSPDDLALALIGAYQGMSLVASALRGAEIMTREGTRLTHWLDALQDSKNPGPSALQSAGRYTVLRYSVSRYSVVRRI